MPPTKSFPSSCPCCGRPYNSGLPRTKGPGSQSAHLHGHLQQIAKHIGCYMGELKEAMKYDLPDWPMKFVLQHKVAASEADVNTFIESQAITWCHVKAAELGVVLREG